jgi:hypothetical protein
MCLFNLRGSKPASDELWSCMADARQLVNIGQALVRRFGMKNPYRPLLFDFDILHGEKVKRVDH